MKKMLTLLLVCGGTVAMAAAFEQKPVQLNSDHSLIVSDTVPARKMDSTRRTQNPTDTFSRPVRDTMSPPASR